MTNRELASKLNTLKNVNPNSEWLASNRNLLLAQISNSGAEDLSSRKVFFINFRSALQAASRPVFALGVFVLIMLSATFSHEIFDEAGPNDSLYIARVISERLKLNTTFGSEARDRLEVKFASNHAKEISAMLADPEFNIEANKDQIAKLTDNFSKEVETVKSRVSRINYPVATTKPEKISEPVQDISAGVVIADSTKDDQGIQVSAIPADEPLVSVMTVAQPLETEKPESESPETAAIMIEDLKAEIETGVKASLNDDVNKILEEAKILFEQGDYNGVVEKLTEVDSIIK